MRLICRTPSLIGSIYGGVFHLTNRQIVLMGLIEDRTQAQIIILPGLLVESYHRAGFLLDPHSG